jgi:hypothetical protein
MSLLGGCWDAKGMFAYQGQAAMILLCCCLSCSCTAWGVVVCLTVCPDVMPVQVSCPDLVLAQHSALRRLEH